MMLREEMKRAAAIPTGQRGDMAAGAERGR